MPLRWAFVATLKADEAALQMFYGPSAVLLPERFRALRLRRRADLLAGARSPAGTSEGYRRRQAVSKNGTQRPPSAPKISNEVRLLLEAQHVRHHRLDVRIGHLRRSAASGSVPSCRRRPSSPSPSASPAPSRRPCTWPRRRRRPDRRASCRSRGTPCRRASSAIRRRFAPGRRRLRRALHRRSKRATASWRDSDRFEPECYRSAARGAGNGAHSLSGCSRPAPARRLQGLQSAAGTSCPADPGGRFAVRQGALAQLGRQRSIRRRRRRAPIA